MKFENVTTYGTAEMLALNRAVNKTARRRSVLLRRVFLFTVGTVCLGGSLLLLLIFWTLTSSARVIAIGALPLGLLALGEGIFFHRLSAWRSKRLLVKGDEKRRFAFGEDALYAEHPGVEKSSYPYSAFSMVCETPGHFIFLLDRHHGLIVDKNGFQFGNPRDFPAFITEKTGKPVQFIK